jgi:phage regulator Rha-like protein
MTSKEISKKLDKQHVDVQAAIAEAKASGDFSTVIRLLKETQRLVKAYGEEEIKNMEQEINLHF